MTRLKSPYFVLSLTTLSFHVFWRSISLDGGCLSRDTSLISHIERIQYVRITYLIYTGGGNYPVMGVGTVGSRRRGPVLRPLFLVISLPRTGLTSQSVKVPDGDISRKIWSTYLNLKVYVLSTILGDGSFKVTLFIRFINRNSCKSIYVLILSRYLRRWSSSQV